MLLTVFTQNTLRRNFAILRIWRGGCYLPHHKGKGAFLHTQTRSHEELYVLMSYTAQSCHFFQKANQIFYLSYSPRTNLDIPMPVTTEREREYNPLPDTKSQPLSPLHPHTLAFLPRPTTLPYAWCHSRSKQKRDNAWAYSRAAFPPCPPLVGNVSPIRNEWRGRKKEGSLLHRPQTCYKTLRQDGYFSIWRGGGRGKIKECQFLVAACLDTKITSIMWTLAVPPTCQVMTLNHATLHV